MHAALNGPRRLGLGDHFVGIGASPMVHQLSHNSLARTWAARTARVALAAAAAPEKLVHIDANLGVQEGQTYAAANGEARP